MPARREMKSRAVQTVRSHYGILFMVCLFAAFFGADFANSLKFITRYTGDFTYNPLSASIETAQSSMDNAVDLALSGDIEGGKKKSAELTDQQIKRAKEHALRKQPILARSHGVFATLINGVSSGSLMVSLIAGARSLGVSTRAIQIIFVSGALLLHCAMWFFLINMFSAVTRRIFLEARIYPCIPFRRFLFFLRVRKWLNVCFVLFMRTLFQLLWSLTIIGGVIKYYSYFMVPYLMAENPSLSWREAISLSRQMMNGHKWECFVADLSFLHWTLLGICSLGFSQVAFSNMYKTAFFSEYYASLRSLYLQQDPDASAFLNDRYLFEAAAPDVLASAYEDTIALAELPDCTVHYHGFRGFLERFFGITLYNQQEEAIYEETMERKLDIYTAMYAVSGLSYPGRLFTIPENRRNRKLAHIHFMRHYSPSSLILMFFIFSFIGWIWEVILHLIMDARFVNRGVMHGPWLPIYGFGGLLMLLVLKRFRKHPGLEFCSMILLSGIVEYFTAFFLELTHDGKRWWDYDGYFLNLDGRICAEGLLVFGLGGVTIVYLVAPLLDNALRRIPKRLKLTLCTVLLTVFLADQIYSHWYPNEGQGITEYNQEVRIAPASTNSGTV